MCVCICIFVLKDIKTRIIPLCAYGHSVISVSLCSSDTLTCLRCSNALCSIVYIIYRLVSINSLCSVPWPPIYRTLEHEKWETLARSQQCSLALISVSRVPGGCRRFWHPIICGSSATSRDGGVWSQQFPGQPFSRVNYYTNQVPPTSNDQRPYDPFTIHSPCFFTLTWVLYHVVPLRH